MNLENIMPGVLVYPGCCNKIPSNAWLINSRDLFLTVLEAGIPRLWHPQSPCLVRARFLTDGHHVAVPSSGRRTVVALWDLFHNSMNPIHEGSTPSQRSHLQMPSLWGLGFQYMNGWRGDKHPVCCTK